MKNNYLVKYFIKSNIFKVILGLIILVCLFSRTIYVDELVINIDASNYINRLCYIMGNKLVALYVLPLFALIIIIGTCDIINRFKYFHLRFECKKKYHRHCIKTIIKNFSIIYILFIGLLLIINLFFKTNNFQICMYHVMGNYEVLNIIYLIYIIIKLYMIFILYIVTNYLVFKLFDNRFVILWNVIFIGTFGMIYNLKTSFYLICHFMVSSYFINFNEEIILFLLNYLTSILILVFLYDLLVSRMRV